MEPIPFPTAVSPNSGLIEVSDRETGGLTFESRFEGFERLTRNYNLNKWVSVWDEEYHIKANWKLLIENFLEWYHLQIVHPQLVRVSTVANRNIIDLGPKSISFETNPLVQDGKAFDLNLDFLPPLRTLDPSELKLAQFHFLWPNLCIFLFPSHAFLIFITPLEPNKTLEKCVLLVNEETEISNSDAKVLELVDFYHLVNTEDIEICEKVQKGHNSGIYTLHPTFEKTIAHFHNMYLAQSKL
jgi:choline monooxygenase